MKGRPALLEGMLALFARSRSRNPCSPGQAGDGEHFYGAFQELRFLRWNHISERFAAPPFPPSEVHPQTLLVVLFRQGYAASNRQLLLFPTEEEGKPIDRPAAMVGVKLYGILLHGQSEDVELPGFAVIRFPNYECE